MPIISQSSAPSKHPIGTSNSSFPDFFTQGWILLNNVLRDCIIIDISWLVMSNLVLAKFKALLNKSS